jgi:heat shock protein HtpX
VWEAIRENRRRSTLLIALMGSLLVGLGALIGAFAGGSPETAAFGALAALVLWGVQVGIALSGGEQVVLRSARARPIQREDHPRLWNVVEEMTIASGLGTPPKVYLIDDETPNAFATGRSPETGCVAVTTGLLKRLNRDELQGVIAHEIGHIKNYDIRFMTIAAVMVGSVAIISDVFLRYLWWGGGRRKGRGGGGQAQAIIAIAAIVIAILAPIATRLLYFAVSRRREYLADASAARYTRYPPGLASALEKIGGQARREKGVSRVLAPMYIVNPLQAHGAAGMFATHPPTARRIAVLRAMGGGAGWADYDSAFRQVTGKGAFGAMALPDSESVTVREGSDEPQQDAEQRAREVTDLLDRMVGLLLVPCVCGVQIKVPESFKERQVACPRCKRAHALPAAESRAEPDGPLRFQRRGEGWESFRCRCGHTVQLSPAFKLDKTRCRKCGTAIELTRSA